MRHIVTPLEAAATSELNACYGLQATIEGHIKKMNL